MDQALIEAYRTTNYVVFDRRGDVTIRIGERSGAADQLLVRFGARSAVSITAWNPFSRSLPIGQNKYRQLCLVARLRERGFPILLGEGRGVSTDWPPEPSVLALGTSQLDAARMGRVWGQNAVVFLSFGRPVRLLLLRLCR
jgi:hypothetical protein